MVPSWCSSGFLLRKEGEVLACYMRRACLCSPSMFRELLIWHPSYFKVTVGMLGLVSIKKYVLHLFLEHYVFVENSMNKYLSNTFRQDSSSSQPLDPSLSFMLFQYERNTRDALFSIYYLMNLCNENTASVKVEHLQIFSKYHEKCQRLRDFSNHWCCKQRVRWCLMVWE